MDNNKNKKILIIIGIIVFVAMIVMSVKKEIIAKFEAEAKKQPPSVEITTTFEKDIIDTLVSTGRIEAKYSVDVVARIQGWLEKSYFKEGDNVKEGSLLFLIEPDNYQIAVNQATADLQKAQADYVKAEKDLKRAAELVKLDYVSKAYYDHALSDRDMAKATVASSRAKLANARLNLSYTRVVAPVSGKIGKILITQGNYVTPTTGTIAKIVSTSPIYAYFTVKSEDYLNFQKHEDKELKSSTVELTLADGTKYEEKGKIEFINNEIDPTLGTIGLRATFKNEKNILVPSDYVNVTISSNKTRRVLLVPEEAVQESKDGMFVYTIDADNKAIPVIIKVDGEYDGNWIVTEGLTNGQTVISKGLLSVKPNQKVKIKEPTNNEDTKDILKK